MPGPEILNILTEDGIHWYCERRGTGPHLVLIPSGEGDCESFNVVAAILAESFTVITFDMPGMSRTTAPASALQDLTSSILAAQIIGLLDKISVKEATFWGCSSGALTALTLAVEYPARVRSTIVHEAPFTVPDKLLSLRELDDASISDTVSRIFASSFIEDEEKRSALGSAYHDRLKRNHITWVRAYVGKVERSFSRDEIRTRPTCWTVGALTPVGVFWQFLVDGFAAGVEVGLLPCKHFPQVTIPERLAGHIKAKAEAHL